ncbi:MAG: CDP-glycerol glycerophosphotransferase family protein [Christensenellales bacterium]
MLRLLKAIVYAAAFIINIITRPAPVKNNRVVFISYFLDEPEGNFLAISKGLTEKGGFEIIQLLKKYEGTAKSKLRYFFNILKQAYYFNTAKVVVLDANSVVLNAIIKKKKTIVLQIWHACGALKRFGKDTKSRLYSIKPCDAAIASCEKVRHIYGGALNIPVKKVFALGSPRADALFCSEKTKSLRKAVFEKYNIPADRKILLYAPTFRGGGIDDVAMPQVDVSKLAEEIKEEYILAVRLHPLIRNFNCPENVINLTNEDLISALCATDVLVTDYSTIMFEFALLNRPMVFHAPDIDCYKKERGFYMDYEAFVPGRVTKSLKELTEEIKNIAPDMKRINSVKNGYFDYHDGLSTKRAVEFIEHLSGLPDAKSITSPIGGAR